MSIDTILLLLESMLLVATILLLLYSIKESRRRRDLLLAVSKATKTLTRIEYFTAVEDSITEAKEEIIGYVTGRRATGEDDKRIAAILDAISKATKRGVRVQYMLPKFHGRLYMGYLYSSAGAEVRYREGLSVQSLRYMVVDGKLVIIGIPETLDHEEMTSKGHWLPSIALAEILSNHFQPRWRKSLSISQFVDEVSLQTGASIDQLAIELGIEPKGLKKYLRSKKEGKSDKMGAL